MPRPLPVLLLLPALAGCAERCPGAPPRPVFGGGSGVECRLLAFENGRPTLACFKRCPPDEPVDMGQQAPQARVPVGPVPPVLLEEAQRTLAERPVRRR